MQLYSSPISPYAARCRIQITHKQLPVDIIPPPGGMSSDAVRCLNPTGRIPVLDMGERSIAESWAIMNFLESTYPQTAMRSTDAFTQAKHDERIRFVDIYLAPAMFPLFRALRGGVSEDETQQAVQGLRDQLGLLEQLLTQCSNIPLDEPDFSLADAALLPIIWYAQILARHYGEPDCLASTPRVQAWWQRCSTKPAAASVLQDMETALRAAIPPLFA